MLLTLLLQAETVTITRSDLNAVYLALGGTLFSALLAAAVAFRASNKSAEIAREVAELTTKTTRETAEIASQTAKELNKSTYKNDFYKMIIDNRLKVWKEAEKIIGLTNTTVFVQKTREKIYSYFVNGEEFRRVYNAIREIAAQSFWMGAKYSNALEEFHKKLSYIARECSVLKKNEKNGELKPELDDEKIVKSGIECYGEMEGLLRDLMKAQAHQIVTMYDVEAFFAEIATIKGGSKSVKPD